jgi:hypothetical protein
MILDIAENGLIMQCSEEQAANQIKSARNEEIQHQTVSA